MKTKITFAVLFIAQVFLAGFTHSASAQCRDPWVTSAIKQVYGRNPVGAGEFCECNIRLYNNGSWNSYKQLVGFVQQVKNSGLQLGYAMATNGNAVMVIRQGGKMAVSLVNSSGQVISAGGGNVISAGGGNVISAGGGNVISAGGGNFNGLGRSTPGFRFGSNYQTLSSGQSRLNTSGSGSLIVIP
jgi:hypothetical protein